MSKDALNPEGNTTQVVFRLCEWDLYSITVLAWTCGEAMDIITVSDFARTKDLELVD